MGVATCFAAWAKEVVVTVTTRVSAMGRNRRAIAVIMGPPRRRRRFAKLRARKEQAYVLGGYINGAERQIICASIRKSLCRISYAVQLSALGNTFAESTGTEPEAI